MNHPQNDQTGNFIRTIIDTDRAAGRYDGQVRTRFPPEPNGYLHIGHAKSICLNFGLAQAYQGTCNLRFDDTNPEKEDTEYMEAIKRDVTWLGYRWHEDVRYASHYYQQFYDYAVALIRKGKAYVCELTPEQIRSYRGTLTEPGKPSPYRDRSIDANLDLFARMRAGEFADGAMVLRAKIDMTAGNINMRDPIIYRIKRISHYQTGDTWCIYPMYDFAHGLSDHIEAITHSLCTLEFQDHRPLYDWFLDQLVQEPRPHQYEFARLNLDYTVTSKRKLKALVDQGVVNGWDDPRLPTLVGLRRRGYTPTAIRNFCERIGVAKKETTIDVGLLEEALRTDLNTTAPRAFAVLRPIKLILRNYPEGPGEELLVPNHPQDPQQGKRPLTFARELYIDQDDFSLTPPAGYHRLAVGREVRLRYGYVIRCDEVEQDPSTGAIKTLYGTYDPETLGKKPVGRKVKGIIHWLNAATAKPARLHLYDRLFNTPNPAASEKDGGSYLDHLNPHSLETLDGCYVEPSLATAPVGQGYQFERLGYFCCDPDTSATTLIFNRAVSLRDSWGGGS